MRGAPVVVEGADRRLRASATLHRRVARARPIDGAEDLWGRWIAAHGSEPAALGALLAIVCELADAGAA